jgi:hypothetical protein
LRILASDFGRDGVVAEGRGAHIVKKMGLPSRLKRLVASGIRPWPWVPQVNQLA